MKKFLLALSILVAVQTGVFAQNDPLGYLKMQCPNLTEMYRTELENCHAHYIMAVDVSLSMCRYESDVLPALKSFIKALPVGDKVTLIPFAKTANDNRMGFDVEINAETKASLLTVMEKLYPQGDEKKNPEYKDIVVKECEIQGVVRKIIKNV